LKWTAALAEPISASICPWWRTTKPNPGPDLMAEDLR
jgi:hypothetical protein